MDEAAEGFAKLGIRGLKSPMSVRKYRQAWQHAIDNGWAEASEPGKKCGLPEQQFEFPKLVHKKPKTPPAPPGTYETIVIDPPGQNGRRPLVKSIQRFFQSVTSRTLEFAA